MPQLIENQYLTHIYQALNSQRYFKDFRQHLSDYNFFDYPLNLEKQWISNQPLNN